MEIAKIITVFLLSTLKFLFGITGGYAAGWSMWLTMLITAAGMMTSVTIFAYFGSWIKKRFLNRLLSSKKTFTPRKRRIVRIWQKYGLLGVAFFTPILLMPIGGTLIATAFGSPKEKIISYMLVSAVLWAIVQTIAIYKFGDLILPLVR